MCEGVSSGSRVYESFPPRRLALFTKDGYDKGRPVLQQALWFACLNLVFIKWWLPPAARATLLRWFGAKIGANVFIRHRVRVLWPWKLEIANDCWIGEGAWLLNLEPISIGHDVCISQDAFLCTGSHDYRSPRFVYDNGPISVGAHSWIAAKAVVLRGVNVGEGTVVGAGAIVTKDTIQDAVITSGSRW